jgi:hypothetical protein
MSIANNLAVVAYHMGTMISRAGVFSVGWCVDHPILHSASFTGTPRCRLPDGRADNAIPNMASAQVHSVVCSSSGRPRMPQSAYHTAARNLVGSTGLSERLLAAGRSRTNGAVNGYSAYGQIEVVRPLPNPGADALNRPPSG